MNAFTSERRNVPEELAIKAGSEPLHILLLETVKKIPGKLLSRAYWEIRGKLNEIYGCSKAGFRSKLDDKIFDC